MGAKLMGLVLPARSKSAVCGVDTSRDIAILCSVSTGMGKWGVNRALWIARALSVRPGRKTPSNLRASGPPATLTVGQS